MALHPFVQKVAGTIKRHRMAGADDRLLVGVSGGADSVCLARALDALGYDLGIAHVNHGLRGSESDADEVFTEALAGRLRAPFFPKRVASGEIAGNLEASARQVRRRFLGETATAGNYGKIALAHSRDDRNETLLLHLLRGSGARGLVSMKPVSGRIVRPLIEATRAEIEDYLREIRQDWRIDRTNQDLRFARNRVRHDILPRLSELNPRVRETLARTVEILSAEDEWMDTEVRKWLATRYSPGRPATEEPPAGQAPLAAGPPRLVIDDLASRPIGFVRRALRAALQAAGSGLIDVGFDHLEQVRSLLEPGKSGKVIELPGTLHVAREFDALVFLKSDFARLDYEYELTIPGRVRIAEARLDFEARVVESTPLGPGGGPDRGGRGMAPKIGREPVTRVRVDGESLGPCVKIRNWKNGDTYDPSGLGQSTLKALFQKERIPRSVRWSWPVFVARSSIVWVASFPVSRDFVPTERSRRIIEFEAFPSAG